MGMVGVLADIPIDVSKQRRISDKYAAIGIGSNPRAEFGPHFYQIFNCGCHETDAQTTNFTKYYVGLWER
jgi:hypothetical protein